jgi:hypothetical protein
MDIALHQSLTDCNPEYYFFILLYSLMFSVLENNNEYLQPDF